MQESREVSVSSEGNIARSARMGPGLSYCTPGKSDFISFVQPGEDLHLVSARLSDLHQHSTPVFARVYENSFNVMIPFQITCRNPQCVARGRVQKSSPT